MNRALIVVDVQNDFIDGSLKVEGGDEAARKVAAYVAEQAHYDYVVATQDWHIDPGDHFSPNPDYVNSWPRHCEAGSVGADLHWSLNGLAFDAVFRKGHHSAAYSGFEGRSAEDETLDEWLGDHNVTEVDICGIATDYCVKATALDARELDYITTVLLPLTAAVSPDGLAAALDEFDEAGVVVA
ncbi:isochorismatase family protein [Mycolicibacterium sp. S2-37]|uniref:isochorismatase family protein n=1 Tax=Mycolicibacterium sp. S2-37 TaxID=2810297 RepID=UPI001A94FF4E|nr:isochorismatase family protein [Mycolicibacterium sp. S2-37]MBO0676748.1 isochorismatase family protein [Mycolicibacterium sp. S2-37]